jgi:phage baseplate assembly protein W
MRRFLFEPLTRNTLSSIESKIREQVKRYLPAIIIEKIFIDSVLDNPDLIRYGDNYIQLSINYTIIPIGANVSFNLEVTDNSVLIGFSDQPEF